MSHDISCSRSLHETPADKTAGRQDRDREPELERFTISDIQAFEAWFPGILGQVYRWTIRIEYYSSTLRFDFSREGRLPIESESNLVLDQDVLIALETFLGGIIDLTHGRTAIVSGPFVTQVVTDLGYPVYVLAIIGAFKIPGAITIVVPGWLRLKEWAYAGIVFELSGAVASHVARGNWGDLIPPLSLLGLTIASWALRPPSRVLGAVPR